MKRRLFLKSGSGALLAAGSGLLPLVGQQKTAPKTAPSTNTTPSATAPKAAPSVTPKPAVTSSGGS